MAHHEVPNDSNFVVSPEGTVPLPDTDADYVQMTIGVMRRAGVVTDPYEGMHKSLRMLLEGGLGSRIGGDSHGNWPI